MLNIYSKYLPESEVYLLSPVFKINFKAKRLSSEGQQKYGVEQQCAANRTRCHYELGYKCALISFTVIELFAYSFCALIFL